MPLYRILRMKDADRQRFRLQPHTAGTTVVKPKEFEERGNVEATSFYAAWGLLKDTPEKLEIGDILIAPNDEMRILKYVGFEQATWAVPAPASSAAAEPAHARVEGAAMAAVPAQKQG